MPIELENLSVLAYANGFTLWHYRMSKDVERLCAGGRLLGADDMLRTGDLIVVTGGCDGPAAAALLVVAKTSANGTMAAPLVAAAPLESPS